LVEAGTSPKTVFPMLSGRNGNDEEQSLLVLSWYGLARMFLNANAASADGEGTPRGRSRVDSNAWKNPCRHDESPDHEGPVKERRHFAQL